MISTTTQDQIEHRRQEVVQAIDNACDQMRSEGVQPHNYVEQLSWLFFLKAFDESESRREEEASFEEADYERLLAGEYRWSAWASKTNRADEMLDFVDKELWPHLRGLHDGPVAERLSRIFSTIKNHQTRGASFARVVTQVDKLHFSEKADVDVLSEIYERLLKDVASVAGYAGEFYTPRHIVAAMVQVVGPRLGDRVYDPCFGSGGFLWMAANEIRRVAGPMGLEKLDQFHKRTIYGRELGPLAYLNGTMGLLLHDVREANLELINTLEAHSNNFPERDRYSVILANPPYGGRLPQQVQTNFTVRSAATEILFLQHIMASLAKGGRAAVIVPEGLLFRGGPDAQVRKRLLEEFNVHTILSLPAGCFLPYTGVKANVLFFNREADGHTTEAIWYYEVTNDGFELRQNRKPIPGGQLQDFHQKITTRVESQRSWLVRASQLKNWDLSAQNPNRRDGYEHRGALDLVYSLKSEFERVLVLLEEVDEILSGSHSGSLASRLDEISAVQGEMRDQTQHILGGYFIEAIGLDGLTQWSECYDHTGDFEWKPLEDVCSLISRGRHSKQGESDTFLIKTRHVWPDGVKDYSDCRLCSTEGARVKDQLIVRQHDVLLACSARGSLGRSCYIASAPNERVTVDTHVAILRAEPTCIDPMFLFAFLNCPLGRYLLVSAEAGGRWHEEKIGFRYAELNLQDLKSIRIPVPTLERQKEIVARLSRSTDATSTDATQHCARPDSVAQGAAQGIGKGPQLW